MQRSNTRWAGLFVAGFIALAWACLGPVNVGAASQTDQGPVQRGLLSATAFGEGFAKAREGSDKPPASPVIRVAAKKKIFKYEIPKAERAVSPSQSASPPQLRSPQVFVPQTVPRRSSARSSSSLSVPQGTRVRRAPVVHYGGSCGECRTACYSRWRLACGASRACTQQFVPCMRSCWYRLCRG